jgi:predicted CxxxxCH...CXXCH cytochrome family protein
MDFSDFANNTGALSIDWNGTVCSNTYCHGNDMPKGSNPGIGNNPTWADDTYLSGSFDTDCDQCHGFPPTEHSSHSAMTPDDGAGCYTCHDMNPGTDSNESGWGGPVYGVFGSAANAAQHIDGTSQGAGACDGCHDYPPRPNFGYAAISVESEGAHLSHVVQLETLSGYSLDPNNDVFQSGGQHNTTVRELCLVCHFGATHEMSSTDAADRTIVMNATEFQFGQSAPSYAGTVGTVGATTPKTCSNVSCHYIKTPEWEQY